MAKKNVAGGEWVVKQWLVLGSFANEAGPAILEQAYLPEPALAPSPGERAGKLSWATVNTESGVVNLLALPMPHHLMCAAYAFSYVHAARASSARLLLQSDDGVAAWVNGVQVWRNDVQRGLETGVDTVEVSLQKGWNRLLLKISQFEAGWQMRARIQCPVKLSFGLENPDRRMFPGPGRAAAEPIITRVKLVSLASGRVALKTEVTNAAAREGRGLELSLLDAAGEKVAGAVMAALPALDSIACELELETVELAKALRAPGARLAITGGKTAAEMRIRERLVVEAMLHVAGRTPRLQKLAGDLANAMEVHKLSPAPLVEEAHAILGMYLDQDEEGMSRAMHSLLARALEQIADRKKTDRVHVIGHAHIDMNWLWTYPETVKSTHDTFRQVIAFMDEFDDFTFLQSQPACYKAVEHIDPPLFERIREYVKQGRWEIAGGMYTEGDTNLSGGEGLCRSFLLGQSYFIDRFGKAAKVGWLPDNFGHTSQLPQVLKLGGCDYYYFHRCQPQMGTFWWQGIDGSKVLCFSNNSYNGRASLALAREIEQFNPQTRRVLHVCGVGDHGGGPTREDIELIHRLDQTPRHAAVKFTTAQEFFASEPADRPVHKSELPFIFEGCYTTVARVKQGNRWCESALVTAETLASLQAIGGEAYPAEKLRSAWEIVTFNQFHDILPGSAIHETNQDAVADYKWALSRAEDVREQALRKLADQVKCDAGKGQPLTAFNPLPRKRRMVVEAEVFSHARPKTASLTPWANIYREHEVAPAEAGMLPSVRLQDSTGRAIAAQVVWGKEFPPGWRWRVRFVDELPAGGYKTYYLDPAQAGEFGEALVLKKNVVETAFYRVGFDMKTGEISRLLDRRSGKELVARGGRINRLKVCLEKAHSGNAWVLGKVEQVEEISEIVSVKVTERGPVRLCVEAVKKWGRSRFIQRTYVYRESPRIEFELEAHWFEQGAPETVSPLLRTTFDLSLKEGRFDCHVPFEVRERPATGREVPAQQWVDVTDGKVGVALLNTSKHGHAFEKGQLRLTLLRSTYNPDRYPDQGVHTIRYALLPHEGDWAAAGIWDEGDLFNRPAVAAEPPSLALGKAHATRSEDASLMELAPANVSLSGMKQAESGEGFVVRLIETQGKAVTASLRLPNIVRSAQRLDLIERPLEGVSEAQVSGDTVRVAIKPHEIVTLGVRF